MLSGLGAVLGVAPEVAGDQQRVDLAATQEAQRQAIEDVHVLLGGAGQVDRVRDARRRREELPQGRDGRRRELRHVEARLDRHRRRDADVAAAVAQDGDPAPARGRAAQQRLGGVDELARGAHAQDARGGERGVDGRAVGGQCAGVRVDRAGPGPAAVDGQRDHRRATSHGAGGRTREGPSVAEVLDVDSDDLGGVVGGERLHEVGGAKVGLVTQRGKAREAEPVRGGHQPELEREVAALRDEADRARGQRVGHELQPLPRVQHAQAVGPQQHGTGIADTLGQQSVVVRALLAAGAGADDDERARPDLERLVDGRRDRRAGHGDDHELGCPGQLLQRPIGGPAEDGVGAVVDEVGGAMTLPAQGTLGQPIAPLARVLRGADDRHRGGIEQRGDGAFAGLDFHGQPEYNRDVKSPFEVTVS